MTGFVEVEETKETACRVAVRVLLSTKLTFIASSARRAVGVSLAAELCGARGGGGGSSALRGDSTGDKTDSARQAGPAPRASAAPRRRWVPPSTLRSHDVPDGDAKHDVIFRKVRGILNKLTPEKFQKLSDDLLALELDSDKVLKGVILLIFEKALDEPKYSSMYAQLCKRLSEEAPDFEPRGSPCTFKLLLLNKCRTEFENRAQAFEAYEERALLPDEQEKRHLAKCKMLGNIKFIGELGKLEILAESILHRCIQNLLARRAAADHHEDLECLAQLVRTCGRVLDSERGRGLMDQYFARIETLSRSRDLQPRIRFMLRDVVELRRGGWVPRAASSAEGPVPMHQLRDDSPPRRHAPERDALFRGGLRARPLDDVFAGLALQAPDKLFGARDAYRQRSAPPYFPRHTTNNNHNHYSKQQQQHQHQHNQPKEGGSRASKSRVLPAGTLQDVQMRPAANSLMFTANRISKPSQPQLAPVQQNVLAPAFSAAPPLLKEPAITIKPAGDKRDKPKKDKGPNKEEACRLALEAVACVAREYATRAGADRDADVDADADADAPVAEPLRRLLDMQLPDKVVRRCIAGVLESALAGAGAGADADADEDGDDAELWAAARVVRCLKRAPLHEAARQLLAAAAPARPARLAGLLAQLLRARLLALADVAAWCEAGAPRALLLDALQRLRARAGEPALRRLLDDSKLDLGAFAGGGRGGAGADAALALLEARGLGALAPQLRVRAALARALAAEPAPAALFRWIKGNVEPAVRASPAFVGALVALLAAHVAREAGAAPGDKAALAREKALLEAYAPVLSALLAARADLQLAAVYAAQLHAHEHGYPKGMLLRWFMHLYNLEVCEEEAFLRWREDVTDAYPGKGEALFQVNTWLTWLQQQESEEEEGED